MPAGGLSEVCNASTGEVLAMVAESGAKGVAAAVDRAKGAALEWRTIGAVARGEAVAAFGDAVAAASDDLALLDARNTGNPITGMRRGALQGARTLRFPPTLFDRVTPDMTIAREEIFGPVLGVIGWTDEAQMLAAVNATDYGLTASIYTHDLAAAHRLAADIEAGYIWINDVEKRWVRVPFGGQKNGGTGTEYSIEELYSYTQNKTVSVNLQ